MRSIVFLMLTFLSTASFGYVGCNDLFNNRLIIFYSNGMSNSPADMEMSLKELEDVYKNNDVINVIHNAGHTVEFQLSINHYDKTIEQLIEVVSQKYDDMDLDPIDKFSNLDYWLRSYISRDWSILPSWFKPTADIFLYEQYKYEDQDLLVMISNYEQVIADCKKVFVVAHSQGNFYSNYSWDAIYQVLSANSGYLKQIDDFGLLSVATPSKRVGSYIHTDNDHKPYTGYVNGFGDIVGAIGGLPITYTNTGFTYGKYDRDKNHHNFINSYLKGTETKQAILSESKKILSNILNVSFDGTITHNGYAYKSVTSPHTNRVWLDRNLGASRVCNSISDTECFGDFYQWGRNSDGHEKKDSSIYDESLYYLLTINVNNVGHDKFISSGSGYNYDWGNAVDINGSVRSDNWSKTDGSSICPISFRVPTDEELSDEFHKFDNSYDSPYYNTFLKLPTMTNYKNTNGVFGNDGVSNSIASLWSSTATSDGYAWGMRWQYVNNIYLGSSIPQGMTRDLGLSVRCIKN